MNLKQALNVDISTLTTESIKEYAGFIQSQANRSFRAWETKDVKSPAARQMEKSGGRINIDLSADLNLQKKELARGMRFLLDETRTQKGWDRVSAGIRREINKALKESGSKKRLTKKGYNDFWKAWNKGAEVNPNIESEQYKYEAIQTLLDIMEADSDEDPEDGEEVDETSIDEIAIRLAEKFTEKYQNREKETWENDEGVSKYFKY